ncbi:glycosyltransferase [Trinickia fusca]|uniref:Glycosyltransferase n=1 Tax=Trinickia fusca TaxID=2419777 RepID=A0A494X987_9BURK|nr:glycosyltransferase [Trinickia fusca]RKP44946.1 glycosyltransferase [Trinickia fusca]
MNRNPESTAGESHRPLRILFHIDDFGRGGTETALIAWLTRLDRQLFEPALAVTYPTDALAFWRAHSIPSDVPIHILASSPWMSELHQRERHRKLHKGEKIAHKLSTHTVIRPLVARRFLRLARHFDLVCDFDFTFRHIAGRGPVPWFGVSHYSFSARLAGKDDAHVARRVRQFSRYAAVAVLAPAMRREAEQLFAARKVRVVELPNVIDVEAIRKRAEAAIDRPAPSFIVSVARLDAGQKDHKTLLHAYAQLRGRCKSVPDLVLIGEGPDQAMLEREAAELGLRDSVHFLGFCSNPFPYVRQAEMLVLSSRYEGCPMVLAEAMALGTPVVSTDCPTGPRDLLNGGKAGMLVPVGDVGAMAEAMERLLTDPAVRADVRANALRHVESLAPASANQRMLALARELGVRPAARMPAEAAQIQ